MPSEMPYYRLADGVLSVNTAGEEILMDYASGKYFGLRGAATVVVDALRDGTDLAHMCALVREHFGVSQQAAEEDLTAILARLVAAGLVRSGLAQPAEVR